MPKLLLWMNSVIFVGSGIGFMLLPGLLSSWVTGAVPATTSALTDMRATYGGMGLGIGLFFAFCALRPQFVRLGLTSSFLVLLAISVGRLMGVVVDGSPNGFMLAFLAAELLFTVLSMIGMNRAPVNP